MRDSWLPQVGKSRGDWAQTWRGNNAAGYHWCAHDGWSCDPSPVAVLGNESAHEVKVHTANELSLAMDVVEHLMQAVYILLRQPFIKRSHLIDGGEHRGAAFWRRRRLVTGWLRA